MKYGLFLGVSLLIGLVSCQSETEVSPGNRTTLEVEPLFDAGEVVKGEFVTAKFKVTNTGDYPLVIASVNAGCTCTVAQKPEKPIPPGESDVIVAQVDTDKTNTGLVRKSVTIVSNADPAKTILTIQATVLKN